jgi:putative ABC transport system permease protein
LPFKVLGVLTPKGISAGSGQDQDDVIFAPLTTVQKKLLGQEWLRWIMVSAVSRPGSFVAKQQIESLLRDRHKIRPGDPDDFIVRNLADIADAEAEQGSVMTILLTIVASIALLVGGIGIMNIMLVSVSERTREIGIRMAIGARQRDIRNQFLLEALLLSITGGVLGILTGFVAGYALTKGFGGFPFVFSPIAVALAFTVSAIVGISFGYYPAVHAAKLDPVIALRME